MMARVHWRYLLVKTSAISRRDINFLTSCRPRWLDNVKTSPLKHGLKYEKLVLKHWPKVQKHYFYSPQRLLFY
jgi:hypothetical protein